VNGPLEAASLSAALLARKGNALPFPPRLASAAVRLVGTAPAGRPRRNGPPRVSLRLDETQAKQLRLLAAQLGITRQEALQRALAEMIERHLAGDGASCRCLAAPGGMCGGGCERDDGETDVRS
jgi:hypothetical protein